LEQQGLGRDALQVWEDFLGQAHSASVNERPILNKIRQRIIQLRAQLTPQDRGFNVAPVFSTILSDLFFLSRRCHSRSTEVGMCPVPV